MSDECRVCGSKTNAFLCRRCADELEQAIAELPADLRDLQLVAARQARGPLGLGDHRSGVQWDGPFEPGALGDAPWEFAPGAADQIWAAGNTVTTWVRHLCETRGGEPPAPLGRWRTERHLTVERNRAKWLDVPFFAPFASQPLNPIIEWLLTNIDSIRHDEAAAQIHDEITGLHTENERWILGRKGQEVFAGRCDSTQVSFELDGHELVPVAAVCNTPLYGNDQEPDVRCNGCGMKYRLSDRLLARDRQIDDQLARAHQIANALTTIEAPLRPELLRKWIQRDAMVEPSPEGPACRVCKHPTCLLIRRPLILQKGWDDDGVHALYRFGDVRARVRHVQEQRGLKITA